MAYLSQIFDLEGPENQDIKIAKVTVPNPFQNQDQVIYAKMGCVYAN